MQNLWDSGGDCIVRMREVLFILKKLSLKNISVIAIMAALGAVLMLVDFPIAIAPSFYKMDLGDVPCLIGAFALGPLGAFLIQVVKILIKLLLKPTSTAFVGEMAAFICSSSLCVSASVIYSGYKTKKNAIKAMVIGTIIMAMIATIANYYFIIPAYVKMYNLPLETIIGMGKAIFPIINDKSSFVFCCVFPFNLIKGGLNSLITFIVYKHVSPLLK